MSPAQNVQPNGTGRKRAPPAPAPEEISDARADKAWRAVVLRPRLSYAAAAAVLVAGLVLGIYWERFQQRLQQSPDTEEGVPDPLELTNAAPAVQSHAKTSAAPGRALPTRFLLSKGYCPPTASISILPIPSAPTSEGCTLARGMTDMRIAKLFHEPLRCWPLPGRSCCYAHNLRVGAPAPLRHGFYEPSVMGWSLSFLCNILWNLLRRRV